MKCENIEEKISLYIDRQLDWKEEKEFINHIRKCPHCKELLEQTQQLRKMLLELPMEEMPEGLHESILNVIEKEVEGQNKAAALSAKKKKTVFWYRYGAIAASFLLLAAAGNYIYNGMEQKQALTQQLMEQTPEMASLQEDSPQTAVAPMKETITRTTQAPQTSKALPATPTEETNETTEEAENGENTQEGNGENDTQSQDALAQQDSSQTPQAASAQAEQSSAQEQTITMKAAVTEENAPEENSAEQTQKDTKTTLSSGSAAKSVPINMKSKSMKISLKTNDISKITEEMEKKAKQLQGTVQNSTETGSITMQVPASRYDEALSWIEQQGETAEKEEFVEDLAKQYKQIQKQAEEAEKTEKDATEKGQSKRARQARTTIEDCEAALKQLEKAAEIFTIEITLVEG